MATETVPQGPKAFAGWGSSMYPAWIRAMSDMMLSLEYGGSEDQAIAGLLHDVLEDCGSHHEAAIRETFGDAVVAIVLDCTDGTAETKAVAVLTGTYSRLCEAGRSRPATLPIGTGRPCWPGLAWRTGGRTRRAIRQRP